MMVEDAPESRGPVTDRSTHFPVLKKIQSMSYHKRYAFLCQRRIQEQLYGAILVLVSPFTAATNGDFGEMSELAGLKTFITGLAGHVAAEAARE